MGTRSKNVTRTKSDSPVRRDLQAQRGIARLKRDGTCAETRFGLSEKWTSPFKSVGESVQSTAGS